MDAWYWYEFEDGYICCCRGMSRLELYHAERQHGKLVDRGGTVMV